MDHGDSSIIVLLALPSLNQILQDLSRTLGVVDVLLGLLKLLLELFDLGIVINLLYRLELVHLVLLLQLCLSTAALGTSLQ